MIVEKTENIRDIQAVLSNPEIYDRISSDNGGRVDIDHIPINKNYRYIIGIVDDITMALMVYCEKEHGTVCHFQVLPAYRLKYAKEFAKKSLSMRGTRPLFAVTPVCYRPVINFCLNFGFKIIGIHEEPFIKNNISYKQAIMRFER